jgi:glycosyltransferase involved in cell wall biosynthesis
MQLIPTLQGGGAERQLALMAAELAARGVEVAVVYNAAGPNLDLLKCEKILLQPLAMRHNYDPLALISIVRIIRNWRPDILQTWLPQMDILGGAAAHLTGVAHVLSERASALAYQNNWKTRLRVAAGRHAKVIIANSQSGAQYWHKLNTHVPVHIIANAVTPFDTSNSAPPDSLQKPYLLYAGRLTQQKNLKPMITAIVLALHKNPDLNAYILGEGPQESDLRDWISQSKLKSRIHVVGYVSNLYPWYHHASVFVSMSDFEGSPNVVLEAASVGCPLVLSDIPEHRQVVPADGALFVNGHDPVAISEALMLALTDTADTRSRAQQAKTAVSKLSVKSQAGEYLRIYQTLL